MPNEEPTGAAPVHGVAGDVTLPSGVGVVLDDSPSPKRQFAFTVALGIGLSGYAVLQWWIRRLATTPTGLVLTFFVTLAVLAALWLAALGFRTLGRRRLLRQFPGTLVFSFRHTSDVVNGLRQLDAFVPGRRDFDYGSVEAVADLRGLTFWQRNPPEMYASLPWSAVQNLEFGQQRLTSGSRPGATVTIDGRIGEGSARVSLFSVDASSLPVPTRREAEWVFRQMQRLSGR